MPFDFSKAVNVEKDGQTEIIPTTNFNFATAEVEIKKPKSTPSISGFLRTIFRSSPLEQIQTKQAELDFLKANPQATKEQFALMVEDRERDIIEEGVMRQIETPMALAIGEAGLAKPVATAAAIGAFTIKDHFFNARRFMEEKAPSAPILLKDLVEITDLVATGAAIGIGGQTASKFVKQRMTDINAPKSVKITPEEAQLLRNNEIAMEALGIKENHISASVNGQTPISVPLTRVIDLAAKEQWPKIKQDLNLTTIKEKKLPDFKTTNEAFAFGEANRENPQIIQALKNQYEAGLSKIKEIKQQSETALKEGKTALSDKLNEEGFMLAQKSQFYREAFQKAEEKPSILASEKGQVNVPLPESVSKALEPQGRESIYQKGINRYQSIENVAKKAKELGIEVKPGEDPGISADRALSSVNQAKNILREGTYRITKEGNIEKTGEGLKPILDQFEKKIKTGEQDLKDYLIARRTIEDLQRPKMEGSTENIATPEQVKSAQEKIVELQNKYGDLKTFNDTAERLYDYQKRVLESLVNSGLISQDRFLNILNKNPNYIPFERILPEEPISGISTNKKFSGTQSPVKKIKGSDLEIQDPIESIIKNTYKITDAASRNKVFQDIYKLKDVEELGIKPVKPDMKAIKVTEAETGDEALTIFRPSQFTPKGNIVEGFIDGKRKYLEVPENLKAAMTGLNEQSSGLLVKMLSQPASWLRVGATITPEFMLRNPIRDQWTAFMQTQVGYKPFFDAIGSLADITKKTEAYNDWIRSGGSYSGFVELSRPALAQMVKELNDKPSLLKNLNIVNTLQDLSQLMEQATRVGVYKAAIKKGMTAVEAARESRESTINFARRGSSTRDLNAAIAFFNAGLQGIDKSLRTLAKDPQGLAMKAAASITLPSVLLYMINRNEEDYQEIPRWQRDLFWTFKVGENWWRVPKPFLYGQFFGSLPERFLEYLDTNNPKAFKGIEDSLYNSLSPVAGDPLSGLLPTAIKPLIENQTNWSFFRERPIVPESKKRLAPSEQYSKYDTETSKLLGSIFNVSPSKIENLVQGYFGGSGRYVMQSGEVLINEIKKAKGEDIIGKKPTELSDIPLVKGFAIRKPTGSGAESIRNFYDKRNEIMTAKATYESFKKSGDIEKAKAFKDRNPEILKAKAYESVYDKVKAIDKRIDNINESKTLSNEVKKTEVDKLEDNKLKLIKSLND